MPTYNSFLSQISLVAFDFAPKDYALCNGQILPINRNQALFSLLGTTYGGDGRTTFALPNLQGRAPMHRGNGYIDGQFTGNVTDRLTVANIAGHGHNIINTTLRLQTGNTADTTSPANAFLAPAPAASPRFGNQADERMATVQGQDLVKNPADGPLKTEAFTSPNNSFDNMMPYLVLNYIIALAGIFPSRN
ncbi:phage tail protein [Chitinophaga sp. RAB17]|uniref:phage tail protein n=1 Tax=Chitinophaga sp. RAB17 TaxID=3233049 RepID=UPI003F908853